MKNLKLIAVLILSIMAFSCSTDDSGTNDNDYIPNDNYALGIWEEFSYQFNYNGTIYSNEMESGNWKNKIEIQKDNFIITNYTNSFYDFKYVNYSNDYGTYDYFDKNNIGEKPLVWIHAIKENGKLLSFEYNFSEMTEEMKSILFIDKTIPEEATGIIITYLRKTQF